MKLNVLILLTSWLVPNVVFAQISHYAGKTITVVMGNEAGGSADLRARTLMAGLQQRIPGGPNLIMQNMPGAGGKRAPNHIQKVARPDGLTVGAMTTGFLPAALLGEEGVFYDIDKTIYLGGLASSSPYAFITRKASGLNTIEKLRASKGIRNASQSLGHITYTAARMFAYFLGMTETKFVTGYGPAQIDLALERGEVDATAHTLDTLIRRKSEWIEKNLLDYHSIIEVPKGRKFPHPRFADLPDLGDFTKSGSDQAVISMFRTFRGVALFFTLPPGTPKELVQPLKDAMRLTLKDSHFSTEYKKITGEESIPIMPEELEQTVRELPRGGESMALYKKLSGPDSLR